MVAKSFILAVLICVSVSYAQASSPIEAGVKAFDQGDYQSAYEYWLPLAEEGDAEAQLFMGVLYRYGLGVNLDMKQSAYWYESAAGNGDVDAQNEIGLFYELGLGVKQDIWVAESWYERVREQDYCLADTLATGRLWVSDP
jgi:TPR repeat protein